jgi:hypothetical protein
MLLQRNTNATPPLDLSPPTPTPATQHADPLAHLVRPNPRRLAKASAYGHVTIFHRHELLCFSERWQAP